MKAVLPTSRIKRALGLAGAGLKSIKLRSESSETIRSNARSHLVERLGRLRGLPQKMGQILSMSEDTDTQVAFEKLTDRAEPVPLAELLSVLSDEWKCDPYKICKRIKEHGLAASLGQVHKAKLRDGRTVAIKIQYPGIREAIDADLQMLGWLSEPMGGLKRGFDLGAYRQAIRDSLDEELDYITEANHQRQYADNALGLNVIVPRVVDELSTEKVLVTTWEDGETLQQARQWPAPRRFTLARSIMLHYLHMLFDQGIIHADPHPGNYRFIDEGEKKGDAKIVLYDYGCVRTISEPQRLALLRLIHESSQNKDADPYPFFIQLGFDSETLQPLRHKLPALCRVLFEPFASPGKYNLAGWNRGERISDILGEDRWNFRISGPANMIFLMRAFHGLVFYLRELDQPLSWSICLRPILARHAQAMESLTLPEPAGIASRFSAMARHLCIRVSENGKVKAKVTLSADAVESLDSLIDEDIQNKIAKRGISLDELVKQVRRNQYAPQELFLLQDGAKECKVWLE